MSWTFQVYFTELAQTTDGGYEKVAVFFCLLFSAHKNSWIIVYQHFCHGLQTIPASTLSSYNSDNEVTLLIIVWRCSVDYALFSSLLILACLFSSCSWLDIYSATLFSYFIVSHHGDESLLCIGGCYEWTVRILSKVLVIRRILDQSSLGKAFWGIHILCIYTCHEVSISGRDYK